MAGGIHVDASSTFHGNTRIELKLKLADISGQRDKGKGRGALTKVVRTQSQDLESNSYKQVSQSHLDKTPSAVFEEVASSS